MTAQGFLNLAWQTVLAPREVARLLLALRLGREALLTAFALAVTLNALIFTLALMVSGTEAGPLANPVVFLALQATALGASIVALTWVGRLLNGQGSIDGMAILLIWLQALRVLVQTGLLAVLPLSPALGGLVVLAATALGVWILLNFVAEAHGFDTLLKPLLVLILSVLALTFALSTLLGLAGITPNGMTGNV